MSRGMKKLYGRIAGTGSPGVHMGTLVIVSDRGSELPYFRGLAMSRDQRRSHPPRQPQSWQRSAEKMLNRVSGNE